MHVMSAYHTRVQHDVSLTILLFVKTRIYYRAVSSLEKVLLPFPAFPSFLWICTPSLSSSMLSEKTKDCIWYWAKRLECPVDENANYENTYVRLSSDNIPRGYD